MCCVVTPDSILRSGIIAERGENVKPEAISGDCEYTAD